MNRADELLQEIAEHCRRQNIGETTFGLRVANDGHLVRDIRAGRSIGIKMLERIEKFLVAEKKESRGRRSSGGHSLLSRNTETVPLDSPTGESAPATSLIGGGR